MGDLNTTSNSVSMKQAKEQTVYSAAIAIGLALLFALFGTLLVALNAEKVLYSKHCKVESPLTSVHMTNGEIICLDGRELVKISTVDSFKDGYMNIIHELDIIEGATCEDIELWGRTGKFYTVPSKEGKGKHLVNMTTTDSTGDRKYVLLENEAGEHEYMFGTYLSKEEFLEVMKLVTIE